MKKKVVITIILILGVSIVLSGIIIMGQAGRSHCSVGGGLSRASTTIAFGGDFYTTSAQATGLAANAVIDLYKLISYAVGAFFVFVGGLEISITLLLNDIKKIFGKENVEPVTNIDDDENQNE